MGIGLEHQPPHPGAEFGTKDPFARIGEQHLLDLLADMPHRYVTEARTGAVSGKPGIAIQAMTSAICLFSDMPKPGSLCPHMARYH